MDDSSRNVVKVKAGWIAYRAIPWRLLALTMICVFATEILGILLASNFPSINRILISAIDAGFPGLVMFPVLYFFLFRPMQIYQSTLLQTQHALLQAKEELENRVQERTIDLTRTNESLIAEGAYRKKVEADNVRRNHELQLLLENGTALAQCLLLADRVTALQNFLTNKLGARAGSIYLSFAENESLTQAAAWGDLPEELQLQSQHELVCQGQEPVLINLPAGTHTPNPDGFSPIYVNIPLIMKDQNIGFVIILLDRSQYSPEDQNPFFITLANQAALSFHNAWLFDQAKTGREQLRILAKKLVEAQEKERRDISRELHDQTSQALVCLKVVIELLRGEAEIPQKVTERTCELNQIVDEILADLHRLAADLRPGSLDMFGLIPALQQHVKNISSKHGLEIRFNCSNLDERLPAFLEIHLFRLIQEALANIVRHAKASNADIFLTQSDKKIAVRVADDGIGFSWDDVIQKDRLGLLGMRERVEMLGGVFQVDSSPECGTQILIEVPYDSENLDRR